MPGKVALLLTGLGEGGVEAAAAGRASHETVGVGGRVAGGASIRGSLVDTVSEWPQGASVLHSQSSVSG